MNAFLGPGFLQGALTLPHLGGGWQAHAAGFAALVRYNDRAFDEGVEDYGRTVRQRPSRLSLGASRPLGRARLVCACPTSSSTTRSPPRSWRRPTS